MRFDLEIPALDNIKLIFIREGEDSIIPNSVAPLLYCDVKTKDMFPSDFVSIEPGYRPSESSLGGYEVVSGPTFSDLRSDKFLLTNKVRYIKNGGRTPLFYKHKIKYEIKEDAIKIVDYLGIELSKEEYAIEQIEGMTYIYTNKQDKILFVSYSIDNKISKEFLNLSPVFKEAGWDSLFSGQIERYRYISLNRTVATSHDEELYISYISDMRLIRNVQGNLDDNWNIGVLNVDFIDPQTSRRYWTPEFYSQPLNGDSRVKLVEKKKCRKIFGKYVQSQYKISRDKEDAIELLVYNYYTNELKYAFTNNESLANSFYSEGLVYMLILSYNNDGVIELPVDIIESDIVFCTHYTDEEYVEYSALDLNTSAFDKVEYVIVYLKPEVVDSETGIGHAIVGVSNQLTGVKNYKTIEDFYFDVENTPDSECYASYTVAVLAITNILENAGLSYIDVSSEGGIVKDKKAIAKTNIDMIYGDLIDGNISIPTNDSVIAVFDPKRMETNGMFALNTTQIDGEKYTTATPNQFAIEYLRKIHSTLKKNLDASTFPMIKIEKLALLTDEYLIGE